jgi:hypothetical protein
MHQGNGYFAVVYQLLDAFSGQQDKSQRKILQTVALPLLQMPTF